MALQRALQLLYLWRNWFWFWNSIDVKSLFIPVADQSICVVGTLGIRASPTKLLKFFFVCMIPNFPVACSSKLTHKWHYILRGSVCHLGVILDNLSSVILSPILSSFRNFVDMTTMRLFARGMGSSAGVSRLVGMATVKVNLTPAILFWQNMKTFLRWNYRIHPEEKPCLQHRL